MSFFNHFRQRLHFWGRPDYAVTRAGHVSAQMQAIGQLEGVAQYDYFVVAPRINLAGTVGKAVMWGRNLADVTLPVKKISADIVMPCDMQLPWKKLHQGWMSCVGLTINGELYFHPRSRDTVSGTFIRRTGARETHNDFYAASSSGEFTRLFFPDAPFAFKDFSLSSGTTNFFSDAPLQGSFMQWSALTLITADSRVFVAGSAGMGEHGIPPNTQKPNATVESDYTGYYASQVFWKSTIPPYFPVATEISLPGGVVAAEVPQGSLGSVIGTDGQLYAWWCDPSDGTMHPPKKMTGFLTSIKVTSTGSPIKELDYKVSGFPDPNEVRRWVWLDFTEPPPGGTKPIAYAEFAGSNPFRLTGNAYLLLPGMGYTTPPAAWLNGVVWEGAAPQFSCTIFGSSDSFALPLKADMPWLIGSDGCVYHYMQPFVIVRPYKHVGIVNGDTAQLNKYAAFRQLAPFRVTLPGVRFQHAGGGCFVAEDGSYYVPFPRGAERSSLPFDAETAVLDYNNAPWGTVEVTGGHNEYGQGLMTNGGDLTHPDALKTPHALFKIGSGFVSGASNAPMVDSYEGYSKLTAVGIKSDGTLWTSGSNYRGLLGDSDDLDASRRTFQKIADGTEWTSVYSSVVGLDGGAATYTAFYAIQKNAVCRSRTQPMEYVRDDYYSNPVLR